MASSSKRRPGPVDDSAAAGRTFVGKRPRGLVRELLLDAAERLFGASGIDGVSLREIAAAAGQGNVSAVHYYFGDKQGLVDALTSDRFRIVEAGRQRLADEAGDLEAHDSAALLRIFWEPVFDLCVGKGGNWFIQFHLSYLLHNSGLTHPYVAGRDGYPASTRILETLRQRSAHLSTEQFNIRSGLVFAMIWAAMSRFEAMASHGPQAAAVMLDEPIKVAVAAFAAPA